MNKITKIIAGFVAIAAFSVVAVSPAGAATTAELQAQINALMAQLSAMSGAPASAPAATFTRDLTIGATGADVTALQNWLMASGYSVPAGATGYFGVQTQAAVRAYQGAKGLPSTGYFGPLTRASVGSAGSTTTTTTTTGGALCPNGMTLTSNCSSGGTTTTTTTTTSGPLSGGAGSVESYTLVSGLNNEKVGEDEEDVKVAGLEVEADDGSDLELTAVKIVFDESTGATGDFEDYASEVSVWFAGKEVARVDADTFNDDNSWTKTVSLDSGAIVRAGETEDLVVAVSGINNLDSGDAGDAWTVDFSSVRFEDAQGASVTDTVSTAARTFTFESFATAVNAELKITADDDDVNDPHVIDVHASDDTDDVSVLSFTLEAEGDSDLTINKLTASTTVTGASNVDDLVKNITLWIDGEEIASGTAVQDADGASVGTVEDYLFDDLDFTIAAGETVDAEIKVSFNSVADALDEGDTLRVDISEAETDTSSMWDVDDESGERLVDADITGTVTGGADAVYDIGLNAKFISASAKTDGAAAGSATGDDTGVYTVVFDVTSFGDDVFIDADVTSSTTANTISSNTTGGDGILWASTTNSTATSTMDTGNPLALLECDGSEGANSTAPDVTTAGALSYGIPEGETRRCTLSVNIGAVTGDVQAGVRIRGINWDVDSGDSHAYLYTFNLGEFKTNTISLNQQT